MMFSYIKRLAFTAAVVLISGSCDESFLDKAESGGLSEQETFSTYRNINGFVADMYADLFHQQWMIQGTRISYANITDEAYSPFSFAEYQPFLRGTLTPTNTVIPKWTQCYQLIRKTNIFLDHIDNVSLEDPNPHDLENLARMKGEAYFLRAYAYFELFRRYGPVPVIDHVVQITENFNVPRNSTEEVVNFIVEDCDRAADILPESYSSSDLGRASKGAAMMLKGRALLYFASPLHNPANEISRWQRAAAASKDVMDLGVYQLDDDYVGLFHTRHSPEIIFQSTVNYSGDAQGSWQTWAGMLRDFGWGNIQPTQNMVDAYEMKNGLAIDDPGSNYDPQNPYVDRDPRLDYTIYRNGSVYKRRTADPRVETFVGGRDGIFGGPAVSPKSPFYTQTGYNLGDKMVDPNGHTLPAPGVQGSNYWIFSRYGETLLNYAEAQNEALAAPDQSVYDAINAIRARPGVDMPPLPAGLSKSEMRERIRNERRVEMAFENARFWDVRRWEIGEQVFGGPIYGMRITKDAGTGELTYERIVVENRVYKPAYNLFPIPQEEINRNLALEQNPGY